MRKAPLLVLGLCATILITTHAGAAEKKALRIAVMDFTGNNTTKEFAIAVRNKMEAALFKTNAFKLVERRDINQVLKEQGLQMTGCTDATCALELGRLLAAEYIAVGSVDRTSTYTITLKIIKVGRGTVKFMHGENARDESDLQDAVNTIAEVAAKDLAGVTVALPKNKRKNADDASRADREKGSGKTIVSFRDRKKEHLITEFVVAMPAGKMRDLANTGYGGALAFQYRDVIVIGIDGTAIKFQGRASKNGYFLTLPLCATLGFNLLVKDIVSFVPYVSGGGAWNWSKDLGRYPYFNYPKKGTKNTINGFVRPGFLCDIQPGSTLKISIGAHYGMIFNDRKHTVEKGYGAVHAGLGFRY